MKCEWDEPKNKANIRKHRIDFADIPSVFDGPMYVTRDTKEEYGEDRWIGIGFLKAAIVVVVFVECPGGTIRIISARKAGKHEQEKFKKKIGNRLGIPGL